MCRCSFQLFANNFLCDSKRILCRGKKTYRAISERFFENKHSAIAAESLSSLTPTRQYKEPLCLLGDADRVSGSATLSAPLSFGARNLTPV